MNTSHLVTKLRVYFADVKFKTANGTELVSESDGRAGNGFTHWRALRSIKTRRIVGAIADSRGGAEVTVAGPRGDLRFPAERREFNSLREAVAYAVGRF